MQELTPEAEDAELSTTYIFMYSETWELRTPKGLRKTVLNSKVVLLLRSIFT